MFIKVVIFFLPYIIQNLVFDSFTNEDEEKM